MTFRDEIHTTNVPTVEEPPLQPPRIWWHNGDRKSKTGGSFYTKDTEVTTAPDAPWGPDDRFEGEIGYSTTQLRIAVIGIRSQAFLKDPQDPKAPAIWLSHWRKGAQLYTELLCFAEGIEGPIVWAMKGLTGKAVNGVLKSYRQGLLREACGVAGKPLPLWTFWLPIATAIDAAGKIAYVDTGHGSFVTPPALYVPPTNAMDELYVGKLVLAQGADVRAQYDDWLEEQRSNAPVEEVPQTTPQTPLPRRNVPRPIMEEVDLPGGELEF